MIYYIVCIIFFELSITTLHGAPTSQNDPDFVLFFPAPEAVPFHKVKHISPGIRIDLGRSNSPNSKSPQNNQGTGIVFSTDTTTKRPPPPTPFNIKTTKKSEFVIAHTTEKTSSCQEKNEEIKTQAIYNNDSCKSENGLILYRDACERLLSPYACKSPNYWLVISKAGIPMCVTKPCPKGFLWYQQKCVNIADDSICGEGEILYVEFTGISYCDCEPNFIFDRQLQKCLAEHRQGSCPPGQFLEVRPNEGVVCVDNPCPSDDLIRNPEDNLCYRKIFEGICSKSKGTQLKFNKNGTVACSLMILTKNIFEVPALTSCPRGSRRDYLGYCQVVLRFGSGSPFSHRVPSVHTTRFSVCPPRHTRYPNGSCRKLSTLLG